MKTQVFSSNEVKKAAELIKKGELVAFPTETVYGLGANAFDSKAVKKIFTAKGRPSDNPLIVHISDKKQLYEIAKIKNKELVERLTEKFWPGPLTIVLKKNKIVSKEATAGLDTVAVRMPANKIARNLIRYSGVPIAAPSANISGKPSATTFTHVLEDFDGKIAGIIKSKSCRIGLESTVIDLTGKIPMLLRPGGISYESLRKIIPNLKIASHKSKKPKSPGMKYRHYSPEAKIILFEKSAFREMNRYEEELKREKRRFFVLNPEKIDNFHKKMFRIFRDADKRGMEFILISAIEEKGIGLATMNRIRKAAFKVIR